MKKTKKYVALLLLGLMIVQLAIPLSFAEVAENQLQEQGQSESLDAQETPTEPTEETTPEEVQEEQENSIETSGVEELSSETQSSKGILSVAEARALPMDSRVVTVRGVVVGYPLSKDNLGTDPTHRNAGFSLALKDDQGDEFFIPVQVTASFRDKWTLKSNPELLGKRILVTAKLEEYFSATGLKSPSNFAMDEGEQPGYKVTLLYDLNGGKQSDASIPLSYSVDKGTSTTLMSAEALSASREGMTFEGWKLAGSGDLLAPGTEVTLNENATYVAQWKEQTVPGENEVKITFDTSKYNGEEFSPVILRKGSSFNMDKKSMPFPENTDSEYFNNWYQLDGEKEVYTNQATRFEKDTTLYPKYLVKKPIKFHTSTSFRTPTISVKYSIYSSDGTPRFTNISTGSDDKAVVLPEGDYYLQINHTELLQNGIQYNELKSYTRDNYDNPLIPTAQAQGDKSLGQFDAEGNFKLHFKLKAAGSNTNNGISYHRAHAWLTFDAAGVRDISVIPHSHDYQTESLIRQRIKLVYSDDVTTIVNRPGSMSTTIPAGDFDLRFSELPEGMKGEAYLGKKKLEKGDLYGSEKKSIDLYVRPEGVEDFPEDLTGHTITSLTINVLPNGAAPDVKVVLKSKDRELIPTQNNAKQFQQVIDKREYTVVLEGLPANKEIDTVKIGLTEIEFTKLSRNSFTMTPTFSSIFQALNVTLKDVELSGHSVKFVAGENGSLEGELEFSNIAHGTLWKDAKITVPTPKADEGYAFVGWTPKLLADDAAIEQDLVFTANFEKTLKRDVSLLFIKDSPLSSSDTFSLENNKKFMENYVLVNTETQEEFKPEMNDQGKMLIKAVPAGNYEIRFQAHEPFNVLSHAITGGYNPEVFSGNRVEIKGNETSGLAVVIRSKIVLEKINAPDPEVIPLAKADDKTVEEANKMIRELKGNLLPKQARILASDGKEYSCALKGNGFDIRPIALQRVGKKTVYSFFVLPDEISLLDQTTRLEIAVKLDVRENPSTITFKENYQGAPEAVSLQSDKFFRVNAPADPVREGYSFLGWYENAQGSGEAVDFSAPITEDKTLYAKWGESVQKTELQELIAEVERLDLQGKTKESVEQLKKALEEAKTVYANEKASQSEVDQAVAQLRASKDGLVNKQGWLKEEGKWYFYEDGIAKTGWLKQGNTWYYLSSTGAMVTGWEKVGSSWYYFSSSGAMRKGWLQEGSTWYYLTSSGAMATGWQQVGSSWYYFSSSGAMQSGWLQQGSTWYYLSSSGAMVTGWEKIGGSWYYFGSSGAMQNGWVKIDGYWYYFSQSGAMHTGWLKQGNAWYYLRANGTMVTGRYQIDGVWYTFNQYGELIS